MLQYTEQFELEEEDNTKQEVEMGQGGGGLLATRGWAKRGDERSG